MKEAIEFGIGFLIGGMIMFILCMVFIFPFFLLLTR